MLFNTNPQLLRNFIENQRRILEARTNRKIYIYGSGRQGWGALSSFLNGFDDKITRAISKQAHECWVILILLELLLDKGDFFTEDYVFVQPARGAPYQNDGRILLKEHTVWIEPWLPPYNKKKILQKYGSKLRFLINTGETIHTTPDALLISGRFPSLPFPAFALHAFIEFEDIGEQKLLEFEQKVKPNIKWLIECKDQIPTHRDLAQFLFYVLAYKVPSLLILQTPLPQKTFYNDVKLLRNLGFTVEVIENFKVGQRNLCLRNLKVFVDC